MADELVTKVGIGVAIFKGDQILLGLRKGSHGEGEWGLPGGGMEHLESIKETAIRELAEEVGADFKIRDLSIVSIINLVEYAPKHYIDIGVAAFYQSGEPVLMEPEKCEEWRWFPVFDLPANRFATVDRIIQSAISNPQGAVTIFDKE